MWKIYRKSEFIKNKNGKENENSINVNRGGTKQRGTRRMAPRKRTGM